MSLSKIGLRDLKLASSSTEEVKELNGTYCPFCDKGPLDGQTGFSFEEDGRPRKEAESPQPEDGCPTICIYCKEIGIFRKIDGKLNIDIPTDEELEEWKSDYALWQIITSMKKAVSSIGLN